MCVKRKKETLMEFFFSFLQKPDVTTNNNKNQAHQHTRIVIINETGKRETEKTKAI